MAVGKVARLKDAVEEVFAEAVQHTKGVLAPGSAEGDVPFSEVSVRTKISLSLTLAAAATERAKEAPKTGSQLGVIVVHERLTDTPQNRLSWEERAAALNQARAIEAVALPVEKKAG